MAEKGVSNPLNSPWIQPCAEGRRVWEWCRVPQAYSQLNCSCYSYPSKPRLQYSIIFSMLHIYDIFKWLLKQFTQPIRQPGVWAYTCTSYVLYAYLYCIYALVGGAISIRNPYICAVHRSVPTNRMLSSTGPLSVQWKCSYRLQN